MFTILLWDKNNALPKHVLIRQIKAMRPLKTSIEKGTLGSKTGSITDRPQRKY